MTVMSVIRSYRRKRRLNRQMRRLAQAFEAMTLAAVEAQAIQFERLTAAMKQYVELTKPVDPETPERSES